MHIYLDNAATTPLDEAVLEAMLPFLKSNFGNPSSIHTQGRAARAAIETARKTIANLLNTSPSEIFFTSGGTEADNTAITGAIQNLGLKHAITSDIEHHAVLHCLENLHHHNELGLSKVNVGGKGIIDLIHFESILQSNPHSFVSLMHGNNELGNINDLEAIGNLCNQYGAILHSDTVQTVGHYQHDLQKLKLDFMVGSAHKFHGPKGVGFLYVNGKNKISPFIHGGAQERNMRGGTENVPGIIGMAKALELAYKNMEAHAEYIAGLKAYMVLQLQQKISGVEFNGDQSDTAKNLYTVLNISLPASEGNDMLLFNLDIHKISASGGSACSSGTDIGSHVLKHLNADPLRGHVRFSFSRFNTAAEIDYVVNTLVKLTGK